METLTHQGAMSPNLVQLDKQWRAYIAQDPDLRQFYRKKRALAYKHARQAKARQDRAERRRRWKDKAIEVAGMAACSILFTALMSMLTLA